jgi:hypothetical protein
MIDTSAEQPIPLSLAARETPNRQGERGVNVATVWRWSLRGIRGCKLETILIGGQRMTSREALQRFFVATTAAADRSDTAMGTSREHRIEAAERKYHRRE